MKISNLKYKLMLTFLMAIYTTALYLSPISCVFLELTGIPCPGCGMTRALLSAAKLDFIAAFSYHKMFWSVPFLYICFLLDGKISHKKWVNTLFYLLILIGFAINWTILLINTQ